MRSAARRSATIDKGDAAVIGVVDFGAGNTRSVLRALTAVAEPARLIGEQHELEGCDRLVLPGVGAAGSAMQRLTRSGMAQRLRDWAANGRPLLGICLGAQLLLDSSEEDSAPGLGLIHGVCRRFPQTADGGPLRVPHIGWNRVTLASGSFDAYFVHSYWLAPSQADVVAGWTDADGFRFPSLLKSGAVIGAQFHPEKSGPAGRALLAAWAKGLLDPASVPAWS
jgi:glutamine amidotransferase